MTALWVVTALALALAAVAWLTARRTAARLTQLSEMHWELKYQHLELRKQLERSRPEPTTPGADAPPTPSAAPPAAPRESFVPLTSLRR